MESLFDKTNPVKLDLPDADVVYYPHFYPRQDADHLFTNLLQDIPWQQDQVHVFGKTHDQPRLTAFFGDPGKTLSYSGISMQAHPWTEMLLSIKNKLSKITSAEFNTVLLNYYRNGRDSNGWHADNEKYLGQNPVIASLTFGAERAFHLKHHTLPLPTTKLVLEHGSLLMMQGTTQHFWKHQIPKISKDPGGRINLTFRMVL